MTATSITFTEAVIPFTRGIVPIVREVDTNPTNGSQISSRRNKRARISPPLFPGAAASSMAQPVLQRADGFPHRPRLVPPASLFLPARHRPAPPAPGRRADPQTPGQTARRFALPIARHPQCGSRCDHQTGATTGASSRRPVRAFFHQHRPLSAATQRFCPQHAGTGKQVQHPQARQLELQPVKQGFAHAIGGGAQIAP